MLLNGRYKISKLARVTVRIACMSHSGVVSLRPESEHFPDRQDQIYSLSYCLQALLFLLSLHRLSTTSRSSIALAGTECRDYIIYISSKFDPASFLEQHATFFDQDQTMVHFDVFSRNPQH